MSYPDGEAALLALIQEMPRFDRRNATRGDWKPLNSGASDHYVILKPGQWTNVPEGFGASTRTWRTVIEVWQRWVDDAPTVDKLSVRVSEVIEHVERYPSLNGAALMAAVVGGSEMTQRWMKEGGPMWAVQEIYLDWQDEQFTTYAE